LSVCHPLEYIQVQVFTKVNDLKSYLIAEKQKGFSIGFVPTMGALHAGHASLIAQAKMECDIVVASIFVNPTQFNNPEDLAKYPRSVDQDAELLLAHGCHAVLVPSVEEVYPAGFEVPPVPLGFLDQVMEGEFRPGHFQGVVQVVYRFFQVVEPNRAYFGLKDFQQVAVIRYMTKYFNLPVEIVACPTLREADGLAMSSRNLRLNPQERELAGMIYQTLVKASNWSESYTPQEVKMLARVFLEASELELEYFEIVDPLTLEALAEKWVPGAVACIVAYAGQVRLIDNMPLAAGLQHA
jgi:pantoate--beta-alanine ligase